MKNIFIVLVLSQSVLAIDLVPWTIKVSSGPCGFPSVMEGSGMVFSNAGKTYVLTSEHVLFHSNEKYCHEVKANGEKLSLRLAHAEWGNGLALLETSRSIDAPKWETLRKSISAIPGERTQAIGYPYHEEFLVQNQWGTELLQVGPNPRKLFPLVPHLIELVHAHGEFGMSGGPAVSESGVWRGMLSHQVLRLLPGKKSVIGEMTGDSSVIDNHLLIIPAETIVKWVDEYFKLPDQVLPFFRRDPRSQVTPKPVILTQGLRWETEKTPEAVSSAANPLQPSASNIGLLPSVTHGGADGAGVGGYDVQAEGVGIRVSLDVNGPATRWYLESRRKWMEQIRHELRLPWVKVRIPFMLRRSETGFEKIAIRSLNEFFEKLQDVELFPVTIVVSEQSSENPLQKMGSELSTLLKSFEGSPLPIVEQLKIVADLLESNQWALVTPSSVERLADTQELNAQWRELFQRSFEKAVATLKLLEQIRNELNRHLVAN